MPLTISLETTACCPEYAYKLYRQLSKGRYDECSVLPMPEALIVWRAGHRTARKRSDRAERLGYRFSPVDRSKYADDLYAINTSKAERQGRRMGEAYWRRQEFSPDEFSCPRHRVNTYGVLKDETLVAYLWMYRAGELALVSSILGHGDHLANDVMYLLFSGSLEREIAQGGFVVYNRHDSGTEGLRYFKAKLGFERTEVSWQP